MSRIPAAELERVKALDLVRLMEAEGLVLKRIGKDLACACPFHAGRKRGRGRESEDTHKLQRAKASGER